MAIGSVYTPPGVRITEVPRAAAVALGTVPLTLCLIGIGDKLLQVPDESVIRGQVLGETLTVAAVSPHEATLANTSNEEINQTILYRDGIALSNQAFSYTASGTKIVVNDLYYTAGSVYTLDYVTASTTADTLRNANVDSVSRVGSYVGLSDYISGTDFVLTGDTIVWQVPVAAVYTGTVAEPYNLAILDTIKISIDGIEAIEIVIPPGAVPGSETALEVVTAINTALGASPLYGATYNTVAAVSATEVELTSPTTGETSRVEFFAPAADDATTLIFGIAATALPYSVNGVGKNPVAGDLYYVTYKYDRPAAQYNTPIQVFNTDEAFAIAGNPSLSNQLAIASELAFLNYAPSVYMVIIEDSGGSGIYTDNDYITGIQGTEGYKGLTELVALSTRLQVQTYLKESVTAQSSPTVGNRRRGWFGMARGSAVGNTTTADTFVYRSVLTLQVAGDSPGRGRFILKAPSEVSRTIRLIDGTEVRVQLDGTFLATGVAGLQTSFTSMAQTLLRRSVIGYNIDDFEEYLDQESNILGANGVSVVRPTGGNLLIVDPITTEGGGARDPNYMEISARTQADLVAAFLEQNLDSTLIGAVPNSLSGFVTTAKGYIGVLINSLITAGEIGPYENDAGVPRPIDYTTDIIVTPIPGDRTAFKFKFYFQAKFPVKRLSGEFSVGGPVPATV